jgi:hypothetical protein
VKKAAPKPCAECGKASGHDGCVHVVCPMRKPWGSMDSGLEPLTAKSRFITNGKTTTEVGTQGTYRVSKKPGAP